MLEQLESYLAMGGFVMPVLLVVGLCLWTLLGLRLQLLSRGFRGDLVSHMQRMFIEPQNPEQGRGVVDGMLRQGVQAVRRFGRTCREHLDLIVLDAERELCRYRRVVRSLCGAAPLLGLVGTVSGMIETFGSLTEMELFARSGGVAGGISEALVSTQMGLFVAIPGVILGRILDQREEVLRVEVHRAREQLAMVAGLHQVESR